jgi:hypothetical protein
MVPMLVRLRVAVGAAFAHSSAPMMAFAGAVLHEQLSCLGPSIWAMLETECGTAGG